MSKKLAEELLRLRNIRRVSLRAVEDETGISNAYISQLERGEAKNPSAQKLHALAKFYEVPYELLMEWAGYTSPSTDKKKASSVQAALMAANLDEEEEKLVAEYVEFLRSRKGKPKNS